MFSNEEHNVDNITNNVIGQQKNLDLKESNSRLLDENVQSSFNIINHAEEKINFDDFENQIFGEDIPKCDFEGENQTINTNMYDEVWNSVEQETEELSQDNVPCIGVLMGIVTGETFAEKDPILNWLVDVKDGDVIKHIKMTYVFSSKPGYLYYEFKRLQETLSAFGVDKSKIVEKSAENIANVCQYLVGTKIKIMQTRDEGYLRYKVVGVERRR